MEGVIKRDPRGQGAQGEFSAMTWFGMKGAAVFVPTFHSPDIDLIAACGAELIRVQVKTSSVFRGSRWDVSVCTRGGNRSWNRIVKHLDAVRYDYLFVVVGDGRRWLIPAGEVRGSTHVVVGGPKYSDYEIDRGEPLQSRPASLDCAPPWRDSGAVKRDGL